MYPDLFLPDSVIALLPKPAQVLPAAIPLYLPAINLVTFLVFGADKEKARRGKQRVSERTLFFLSLLGGSIGALAGMQLFRHKTQHNSFRIGIPAILLIQLILAGSLLLGLLT